MKAKKNDKEKAPLSWLPRGALEQIADVMKFGADKYSKDNWKQGIDDDRLLSAALRHIYAHCDGEVKDPESNLNHLAHAGCNILFLLWYLNQKQNKSVCYRPNLKELIDNGNY